MTSVVPKIVFIVPYRNRPQHKYFFSNYISSILIDNHDYEIYFSHQYDARSFNRGGTKNIGFLAIKNKYPEKYKDITFVFNDVDTIPFTNIFIFAVVPLIILLDKSIIVAIFTDILFYKYYILLIYYFIFNFLYIKIIKL